MIEDTIIHDTGRSHVARNAKALLRRYLRRYWRKLYLDLLNRPNYLSWFSINTYRGKAVYGSVAISVATVAFTPKFAPSLKAEFDKLVGSINIQLPDRRIDGIRSDLDMVLELTSRIDDRLSTAGSLPGDEPHVNIDQDGARDIYKFVRQNGAAVISLQEDNYRFGADELSSSAREKLLHIGSSLTEGMYVYVIGYADLKAPPQTADAKRESCANIGLTNSRAQKVADLIGRAKAETKVLYLGVGTAFPAAKNVPGLGAPDNRRVDIYFCSESQECYDRTARALSRRYDGSLNWERYQLQWRGSDQSAPAPNCSTR